MGNITFGSFIAEKRKAHKFNLRDTAKHLNIAYGYLCDIEQSRRPAPNGDFVERISAFLNLDKSEHELLLDLAAKSRNTVSADLPDYIMEKDIVRAALRVAKEVDAKIVSPAPEFIGLEKAKQIALKDAGLDETAQKIVFTREELSRNSGKPCYILEFYTDKCAYSYKVDAVSGEIIGKKTEWFSRQESETVPDTTQNSDSKQRRGN